MTSKCSVEDISSKRREKIFELEKQNIENIKNSLSDKYLTGKKCKDIWNANQYSLKECVVYELKNNKDLKDSIVIVTAKPLQGLTWKDLLDIQSDSDDYKTKIENGAWITYCDNKIRYSIAYKNKIIVNIQIENDKNNVNLSVHAKSKKIEKTISSKLYDSILVVDALKDIDYNEKEINTFINDLNDHCITVNKYKAENELLIIEKQELQEEINRLTLKINNATKQIDSITDKINISETETKKITSENESLKNSIINVRKMLVKRCGFIPILGRLIIKDLNKEFGENALPSGK